MVDFTAKSPKYALFPFNLKVANCDLKIEQFNGLKLLIY